MQNAELSRNWSTGKMCIITSAILFLGAPSTFAAGGGISVIPDGSVIVQIANFLLLIWALNMVLYKPIRNMLAQRKEKVTGLEQNIDALATDARKKDEAYAGGIKEARSKGLKHKQALIDKAAEEEKKLIGEINQKAQNNLNQIRIKITADTESARVALEKEVDVFAEIIGKKILGRAI